MAIDLLGPLPTGESILVAVDYYSRYYEIDIMRSTVASKVITSLEEIFARHGLPESLTSDNGPQFVATEFAEYMEQQGIRHYRVTAKWPQANGEVEPQSSLLLKRLQLAHAEKEELEERAECLSCSVQKLTSLNDWCKPCRVALRTENTHQASCAKRCTCRTRSA